MKSFAEVVKFYLGDFFDVVKFFLDSYECFRVRFFDFFRQPVAFDQIKNDDADHYDKKQRDADLLKIADNTGDRAAEKISGTR